MSYLKKASINTWIFSAMIVGSLLGLYFGEFMSQFKFIGTIWLNMLKMIVVPLILCIMALSIGAQKDVRALGRVAFRILVYFTLTTVVATFIGVLVAIFMKPGQGMTLAGLQVKQIDLGAPIRFATFFTNLFSDNMFASFTNANLLQVLVIGILLGISILLIKNEKSKQAVLDWFQSISDMIYALVGIIIKLSPIGILFLMADSFATYGFSLFTSIASLLGTVYLGTLLQILIVYCGILWVMGRISPVQFLRDSMPVWTFTLATCSSAANIPISTGVAKEKFGVPDDISNFVIPLGANINCDGSAILYGAVFVFVCQMNNIPYNFAMLFQMVIVATIISASGSGIPNGPLVKLMIVIGAFGLPVEIVGILAGAFRPFDMSATMCNCMGDLAGSVVVSKMEEKRSKLAAVGAKAA